MWGNSFLEFYWLFMTLSVIRSIGQWFSYELSQAHSVICSLSGLFFGQQVWYKYAVFKKFPFLSLFHSNFHASAVTASGELPRMGQSRLYDVLWIYYGRLNCWHSLWKGAAVFQKGGPIWVTYWLILFYGFAWARGLVQAIWINLKIVQLNSLLVLDWDILE